MSDTLARVQELVRTGRVRPSVHGYTELDDDGILYTEVLSGVFDAAVVEDYPDAARGPTVLTLQRDESGKPIHIVWGIPRDRPTEVIVVTGYRPVSSRWTDDFMRRRKP